MENYHDRKTQDSGTKGECFFANHLAPILFGSRHSELVDERHLFREGDFRWREYLFEIKDDTLCRSNTNATGNIPIELKHSGHTGELGSHYHCLINGVTHSVYALFGSKDDAYPCRVILAPFPLVHELVESLGKKVNLRTAIDPRDGSQMQLLCIPEEQFIESCDAQVYDVRQTSQQEIQIVQSRKRKKER